MAKRSPLFWVSISVVAMTFFLYLNSENEPTRKEIDIVQSSADLKREDSVDIGNTLITYENFQTEDLDDDEDLDLQCSSSFGMDRKAQSDISMLEVYDHLNFNTSRLTGNWQQYWEIKLDENRYTQNEQLTVFLLPHSHCDPGWLRTFEEYYKGSVRNTLNLALKYLDQDPSMKFIWAEMSFFSLWWEEISKEDKLVVKKLVERKQLEFVTGGWVMADEANSHYYSILIQLFEGNRFLTQHLDYKPRNGWSIDPFGLSPTMAYMLKRSGFKNMLIQRTHYLVKQYLGNRQELEFLWRQNWDGSGTTDMMTHMMPFLSYTTADTCGPDRQLCRTYDFKSTAEMADEKVKPRSNQLVEQYKKKGMLYKTNNILVPLGNDFAWNSDGEWINMIKNYGKIANHVNQRDDLYTQMQYGTLDDYFEAAHSDFESKKINLSKLSGDFFTYADQDQHYWSGYYTSRPFHKALDRKLISHLRAGHIGYTYLNAELSKRSESLSEFPFMKTLYGELRRARRSLSLFQHHDGVTGTSKDAVMMDYALKLDDAIAASTNVLQQSLQILTHIKNGELIESIKNEPNLTSSKTFDLSLESQWNIAPVHTLPIPKTIDLSSSSQTIVTVFNSIAQIRTTLASVQIQIPQDNGIKVQVTNLRKEIVDSELFPVFEDNCTISENVFHLHFLAKLEGISATNFIIEIVEATPEDKTLEKPKVFVTGDKECKLPPSHPQFDVFTENTMPIKLSNSRLEVNFDSHGFIESVVVKEKEHSLKVGMFSYGTARSSSTQSGVYLFLPDGPAKPIDVSPEHRFRIVKGRLHSYVETSLPVVEHRIIIYNHSGLEGSAIEIKNLIDISSRKDFELVMRFESDIQSGNISYTDLNAFQMLQRKRFPNLPIQGHHYPMPSAAYVEDSNIRMTVLGGQPVGTASLTSGQIDVIMDRTLSVDDQRGVGQGSGKAFKIINTFKLLVEVPECEDLEAKGKAPMLSLVAHLLKNQLLNPVHIFHSVAKQSEFNFEDGSSQLSDYHPSRNVPCDVELLDAIPLADFEDSLDDGSYFPVEQAAVFLHRVGFDARFRNYPEILQCQAKSDSLGQVSLNDLFVDLPPKNVTQQSLSFLHELSPLSSNQTISLDPMEIYALHVEF